MMRHGAHAVRVHEVERGKTNGRPAIELDPSRPWLGDDRLVILQVRGRDSGDPGDAARARERAAGARFVAARCRNQKIAKN